MSYINQIVEDGVTYDISAKNLVNGFTQTTPGVNALDAAAGKTLKTDLADCVRMPYVNAEIPANSTSVRVTASVPSGYRFIGWCYCSSLGWLGHVYASSNEATTAFYTSSGSSSSARRFNAFYLVLKNA